MPKNVQTFALTSHTSKVMLKILQARLQQYMNCECPDVQAGFRKGRGTGDQIANICSVQFSSVQFNSSAVSNSLWPHGLQYASPPCHTNSWSLLKFMSIELVMPSNHLILCHPLFLPPSIFPNIRVFSSESVLHIRWPKYWSFSFNISPSNEYSGLISFRIDWVDLLAVQGTQIVQKHQFFGAQLPL